ncbi:MAG: PTS sugar transporter subunit IIA [Bacillota bacterium]
MTVEKSGNALNLKMIVTGSTIRAGVTVKSWEDAVDYAGALLLENGFILPSYIKAMKKVFKDIGPYAVMAPGIVLLHARPEDGVIHPCLALITLSTPINFGHSENDPVDLVFAMGAIDKDTHILALQQLAEILADPARLDLIRSTDNDAALFKLLVN